MKLSTKGRYAVTAMVDLARHGTPTPVSLNDISLRQALPLQYLEQLFAKLRKQGLVKSTRGQKGGYILTKNPENICISDIILAVEGPLQLTKCSPNTQTSCHGKSERCLTHDLWENLNQHIQTYLTLTSLADVSNNTLSPRQGAA